MVNLEYILVYVHQNIYSRYWLESSHRSNSIAYRQDAFKYKNKDFLSITFCFVFYLGLVKRLNLVHILI